MKHCWEKFVFATLTVDFCRIICDVIRTEMPQNIKWYLSTVSWSHGLNVYNTQNCEWSIIDEGWKHFEKIAHFGIKEIEKIGFVLYYSFVTCKDKANFCLKR
jgi:hypothetical protein